mgnify:CR=1 FL=1
MTIPTAHVNGMIELVALVDVFEALDQTLCDLISQVAVVSHLHRNGSASSSLHEEVSTGPGLDLG